MRRPFERRGPYGWGGMSAAAVAVDLAGLYLPQGSPLVFGALVWAVEGGDPTLLSSSQQDVHLLPPEGPAGDPVIRASQGRTGPGCHPENVQGSDLGRSWRGLSRWGCVGGAGASLGVQGGLRCVPRCFNHRGHRKTDPSSIYSKCEKVGYSRSTRRACTVCLCVDWMVIQAHPRLLRIQRQFTGKTVPMPFPEPEPSLAAEKYVHSVRATKCLPSSAAYVASFSTSLLKSSWS